MKAPKLRAVAVPASGTTAPFSVASSIYRAKDPAQRMFQQRNAVSIWACFNIVICAIQSLDKAAMTLFLGFTWLVDDLLLLSSVLQLLVGNRLFRLPVRISYASLAVFIFYFWTLISSFLVNIDIGRSMSRSVTWYGVFPVIYLAVAMGVDQATYCNDKPRAIFKISYLFVAFASGAIGIMQWLGIGWAQRFAVQNFEFSDTIRASGLTDYPSQLAFQAFIGMMLLAAPLVRRNLKVLEWLAIGFMVVVILAAQYRSMYYAGIGVGLSLIIWLQARRDKQIAITVTAVALLSVTILFILFPKKLEYGLRLQKNDPTLIVRQNAWKQMEPILKSRPLSGIGPDERLMLGPGKSEDKWSYTVLDNLYITVITCYGYVGIFIFAMMMISIIAAVFWRFIMGRESAREIAFVGLGMIGCILLLSTTGNSLVYKPVGYGFACCLGCGGLTWKEELSQLGLADFRYQLRRIFGRARRRAVAVGN
jgi:hypothetical protein